MIATGNHEDFDSLRAAPPARYRFVVWQIGNLPNSRSLRASAHTGVAIPWLVVLLFVDEFRETAQKGQSV